MDNTFNQSMLEILPFAYVMHKVILDQRGNPVDYTYIAANYEFEKLTGLKADYFIGRTVKEVLPAIRINNFNWVKHYEYIAANKNDSIFEDYSENLQKWYKAISFSPYDGYLITFFVDFTNEINEKNLYKNILSSLEEGIIATDIKGDITMVNRSAHKITGLQKEAILKDNIFHILHRGTDVTLADFLNKISEVIHTGNIIRDEETELFQERNNKRDKIDIIYNISPIRNPYHESEGAVMSFQDITDKKEKQGSIYYITNHDSLTDVYNRTYFNNEIHHIDTEENLPLSVIMGDVNGLKLTNDAFGHLLGDKLLSTAANIMKKTCRDKDIIIRWGGDEFIILLPNTNEEQAEKTSQRIKASTEKELIGSLNLSISLGCATKYSPDVDIMKMVSSAEEVMYRVKMIESRSQKSKTLKLITRTLQEKSYIAYEHSYNVSRICTLIGSSLNLSNKEISELEILGDIHDIGKVAISETVLNKKSCFNDEDWIETKKHPEIGYHIALSSPDFSFLADAILAHHEHYDGTGYPKGLVGEEIPFYARILNLADAFDSMAGNRPYKNKKSREEIITELKKCSGLQFDPGIVDAFINNGVDIVYEKEWYQE